MNMLNRNCKTSFAKPEFLKKAQRANPRLYDIGCYNDNLALMLAPDSDEMIHLEKERRSKLSDLIRPFDYDQLNNLYDLFVPQREKSPEQHYFPKTSKMSHTSSNKEFSKESFRKQTTLLEKRTKMNSILGIKIYHTDTRIGNKYCLEANGGYKYPSMASIEGLSHLALLSHLYPSSIFHLITTPSSISLLSLTKMAIMWFDSPRPPDHSFRESFNWYQEPWGKRCEKNYSSVRRYVADPVNAYPKRSITKLILKGAVIFDVVSYQFRCALNYSKLLLKLLNQEYVARIRGKLIQKLLLNQKCMGYLVRAYYSISPTKYYKDDSCWSADLKSNTTEDVISI
ncbi:hypothetical protein Tco_0496935 [Tanacetum coccineum]